MDFIGNFANISFESSFTLEIRGFHYQNKCSSGLIFKTHRVLTKIKRKKAPGSKQSHF